MHVIEIEVLHLQILPYCMVNELFFTCCRRRILKLQQNKKTKVFFSQLCLDIRVMIHWGSVSLCECGERQRQLRLNGFSWTQSHRHTDRHKDSRAIITHICMQRTHTSHGTHTPSVIGNIMRIYWQKWYCRSTRMDSESIWNWSAYFALIKASALISDWQFKQCWYTRSTSVFLPIPIVNNQQVR